MKIQNFEFEAPAPPHTHTHTHTQSLNIDWNFLAKTYFCTSLQTFYNVGHAIQ